MVLERIRRRRRTAALAALTTLALVGPAALVSATAASASPAATTADTAPAPGGTYVPVTPSRILDTRSALGAARGATTGLTLAVLGHGGVPTTGVAAVVLNVTVTEPVAAGWLSVGPQSTAVSSNVNFLAGQDVAQLAVSQVAADGTVAVTTNVATQVVADVVGWFTDSDHTDAGGTFTPVASPVRAFDSRLAGSGGALRNGQAREVALPARPAGASAVMVNLTAVQPDHQSYLSAWPGGAWTGTSSMNVAPGDIRSNRAIVPIAADGTISLVTNAATVDVVVDVNGWFGGTTGARFVPTLPTRVIDTLYDAYAIAATDIDNPLDGGVMPVAGLGGLPPSPSTTPVVSVWATTTVVPNRRTGWAAFTPYQAAVASPPVVSSDLNFDDADPTPNVSILPLGEGGKVRISSATTRTGEPGFIHSTDLLVDVAGYFAAPAPASSPGLWEQWVYGAWNSAVPGTFTDVVAATAADYERAAILRRDGTVESWRIDAPGGPVPTVLDHGATGLAGGRFGLFVLHPDGTVWTDSDSFGARGVVDANATGFGQVAGVADATALEVGGDVAYAFHADGSVTGWGTNFPPAPPTRPLLGPVRALAVDAQDRRRCTVYRDGRVEIASGDHMVAQVVDGLDAVSAAAAPDDRCVTVDAAGHLTLVSLSTDGIVTTAAWSGPPVVRVLPTLTPIVEDGQLATPTVRALGLDGVVRDRVGDRWVVQPGLTGATVLAGGLVMVSLVPPAG